MKTEFRVNNKKDIKGELGDVAARLDRRRKKLSKMDVPMARASIFLDRWVQTNFKTEGKNVGGWVPFAGGGRQRSDGGFDTSAKLLQDTGRLRSSFLPFSSRNDAGVVSDLPYAPIHHKGKGVPQRRLLPLAKEVMGDIKKIIGKFVKKALND